MMSSIERLKEIMAQLRNPEGGCPWDLEQTMESIIPHTLEEAYEVADAVYQGDMQGLKGELGDLLLQVVFYSQIAKEDGVFDFDEVTEAICEKLVHRHPHVFGDLQVNSVSEQNAIWETIKEEERKEQAETWGGLDGVAQSLPALLRAYKLQNRAAGVKFDWPDYHGALDKVKEELEEVEQAISEGSRIEEEVGDLLFAVANVSRKLGIDPESALRKGNYKFEKRFNKMLSFLKEDKEFSSLSLSEMEALWQRAKKEL